MAGADRQSERGCGISDRIDVAGSGIIGFRNDNGLDGDGVLSAGGADWSVRRSRSR